MTKFDRLIFLLAVAAGLTLPTSPVFAQLKIDEKEVSAELLLAAENDAVPQKAETAAVYIPEPATYGLFAAAGLGLLLAFRRIVVRSSVLAG
jgi:hypothetical protein